MAAISRLFLWWLCSFCIVSFAISENSHSDSFTEELFIKPLSSGHVYNYFLFTTRWKIGNEKETFKHFRLFPLSLGEIVSQKHVQELHLALTQGRWRHQKWGYPFQEAPPGAHLWAWFDEDVPSVSRAWNDLTNALSGQLCASLNYIDDAITVTPKASFKPQGWVKSHNESLLRYASLPRESVCTENLTPWKKFLPCGSKAGLATLLHALQLFTANYMSIALDLKTVCENDKCKDAILELQMSVSLVFDAVVMQNGYQSWSLAKLFGSGLITTCPLASMSTVYVETTNNGSVGTFRLSPAPTQFVSSGEDMAQRTFALYDLKHHVQRGRFNLAAVYDRPHIYWTIPEPPLYATRYVRGYGLQRGGVVSRIRNNHYKKDVRIVLLDVVPWFLRVYMHTLKIFANGKRIEPEHVYYRPGKDREHSHHLELTLVLPAASETVVSYEFERAFLKWTEYPPDASHGFYIGSAVVSAILDDPVGNYSGDISMCPTLRHCITRGTATATATTTGQTQQQQRHFLRIYTESLLVSLPTPDFSMPYNVICLACTVVALAFGPIHNMATNVLTPVQANTTEEGSVSRLKSRVQAVFSRSHCVEGSGDMNTPSEVKKNQ